MPLPFWHTHTHTHIEVKSWKWIVENNCLPTWKSFNRALFVSNYATWSCFTSHPPPKESAQLMNLPATCNFLCLVFYKMGPKQMSQWFQWLPTLRYIKLPKHFLNWQWIRFEKLEISSLSARSTNVRKIQSTQLTICGQGLPTGRVFRIGLKSNCEWITYAL